VYEHWLTVVAEGNCTSKRRKRRHLSALLRSYMAKTLSKHSEKKRTNTSRNRTGRQERKEKEKEKKRKEMKGELEEGGEGECAHYPYVRKANTEIKASARLKRALASSIGKRNPSWPLDFC